MIERFFLKDNFLFQDLEVLFNKGLNVFSGASGSGKSVLLDSILGTFALKTSDNNLSEVSLLNSEDDLIVFKQQKIKNKNRYFINNESINKKDLYLKASKFIHFLSFKDKGEFSNDSLIFLLDLSISFKNKTFNTLIISYKALFEEFESLNVDLAKIEKEEKEILEKKEFIMFEIEKIEKCNPKENEYDELLEIKKTLSKKEKINQAILEANNIFSYDGVVRTALGEIGVNDSFFDDTINELKFIFESQSEKLKELEELNIEDILDRLQDIASLMSRYGSITEAIKYKEEKKKQLEGYENTSSNKKELIKKISKLESELIKLSKQISQKRQKNLSILTKDFNKQNALLHLSHININLTSDNSLYKNGIDKIEIQLEKTSIEKISSGETNRLRLSVLALKNSYSSFEGIIVLDEIDANLSGIESEGVAKVLDFLSKSYQIICISHHPQLASYANAHFLISKEKGKSKIKLMDKKERINEIARMISGENITEKSIRFSKELLKKD